MLFYFFKISCSAQPASRRWTATRSQTLTSRKMLNAFFRSLLLRNIFLLLRKVLFFILPPAASVSPLDRDKVTDLDLEKNAQRIFP